MADIVHALLFLDPSRIFGKWQERNLHIEKGYLEVKERKSMEFIIPLLLNQ